MRLLATVIVSSVCIKGSLGAFPRGEPKTAAAFDWNRVKYVYAFGDSYSFVQGTRGYPNFSFIGDAFHLPFTPQQLLTSEIIPRNTSSDGANWLEYLTGCFGGRPSACPRQLWNFAFAGADIDAALLPRHHSFTVPLVDQVNQWAAYASKVIPHPTHETLTTWWIGINDTGDTVNNATITDYNAFWELEMTSYFKAVQLAYDRGLKNHLFINVPPGERAPASINNPSKAALQRQHIELFNAVLANHTAAFAAKNKGAIVLSFDAHGWFNSVLDNPAVYGFTNVTGFCTCAEPTGFFWYNTGHPTQRVHQLLAEAIDAHLIRRA
ncbi:putative carbohydrate esterase family 16 protein [Lyophyllum shimeji]|uniref:Carbohydrate esterase family 16 protein n=1 Tax=Lyophyllum shimeji TaxID=47721 RepID=A0A9P3UPL1_LYOSH|nr:putative carbohydrate esterase family 16 protein [Lyophyllum shimeji]